MSKRKCAYSPLCPNQGSFRIPAELRLYVYLKKIYKETGRYCAECIAKIRNNHDAEVHSVRNRDLKIADLEKKLEETSNSNSSLLAAVAELTKHVESLKQEIKERNERIIALESIMFGFITEKETRI